MGGQEVARQGASKDARALSCDIARRSIDFFCMACVWYQRRFKLSLTGSFLTNDALTKCAS